MISIQIIILMLIVFGAGFVLGSVSMSLDSIIKMLGENAIRRHELERLKIETYSKQAMDNGR